MGTNFTDIATTEPLVAAVLNDRFDEIDTAIDPTRETLDVPVTAGESLTARQAAYISTGADGNTAGLAYKADADAVTQSSQAFMVGLVVEAISSGETGYLRVIGILGGFSSLTPGAPQYVSATAGSLTETAPTNVWLVGLALSATEVMVNSRGEQDTVLAPTDYGYFAGGSSGTVLATADRIDFSSGATAANTTSNLSASRFYLPGVSDGIAYGYFMGGYNGVFLTITDRIDFLTSATAANTTSNLSQARGGGGAVSDGDTYGYVAGGDTGGASVTVIADRITFSSGVTAANTVSDLSEARFLSVGVSDGSTYGYFAGGSNYSNDVTTADRITFSSGATAANTVSDLSQARAGAGAVSDGDTYGYFAGGFTNLSVAVDTADRITFSSGATAANTTSDLSQARSQLAGVSDGSAYGYLAGGDTGDPVATADRITFSSGAAAANTVSDLSQARWALAGLAHTAV